MKMVEMTQIVDFSHMRGVFMRIRNKVVAVLICVFMLSVNMTVLAAGTSAVSVSNNNPAVGDTFTVTATATESGNMAVKYNANVLSVVGCDAPGFTQSAGEVDFNGKRGTITFKANAAGGSPISVSSSNASASSVVITVGGPQTAAASEDFVLDDVKYTISEKFALEELPEGFTQTQFMINGKNLKGASNGTMNLVYLKPVDRVSEPGQFYIYDQATNTVSNYFYLGRPGYYVIPSEPSELINDSLRKGQITVDGKTALVYSLQGIDDFVYVYGKCSDGTEGWFEYDVQGKTIQRINEAIFKAVDETGKSNASLQSFIDTLKNINIRYIIAGAIFILIVIIAIIINVILKKKDAKADLIDGDETFDNHKNKKDESSKDDANDSDYRDVSASGSDDAVDDGSDIFKDEKELKKEEKKRAKEEARLQKEREKQAKIDAKAEAKRAKEEEKLAKKEAKRKEKEEFFDDTVTLADIYDEYDDFDIDRKDKGTEKVDSFGKKNNKEPEDIFDTSKKLDKSSEDVFESKPKEDVKETKTEPKPKEDVKETKTEPKPEPVEDIFDSKKKEPSKEPEVKDKKKKNTDAATSGIIDFNDL